MPRLRGEDAPAGERIRVSQHDDVPLLASVRQLFVLATRPDNVRHYRGLESDLLPPSLVEADKRIYRRMKCAMGY